MTDFLMKNKNVLYRMNDLTWSTRLLRVELHGDERTAATQTFRCSYEQVSYRLQKKST